MTRPDDTTPQTTTLERLLLDDLETEGARAADEATCADLYRALTRNVWRTDREPEGEMSPSFGRAEWLVGEWRARHGQERLTLAQTGGEGEVSTTIERMLGALGWTHRPLDTGRDDPSHLGMPDAPPPRDHGERTAAAPPADDEQRAAHAAASAERERKAS